LQNSSLFKKSEQFFGGREFSVGNSAYTSTPFIISAYEKKFRGKATLFAGKIIFNYLFSSITLKLVVIKARKSFKVQLMLDANKFKCIYIYSVLHIYVKLYVCYIDVHKSIHHATL